MTRLFRSKSCGLVGLTHDFTPPHFHHEQHKQEDDDDDEEDNYTTNDDVFNNPMSTPFISPLTNHANNNNHNAQFTVLDILVTALRKSIITCSVEREDVSSMDISWPTEVRHVSHVTFDRFNGFLGLPTEFEPELPRKVPSASANVFGVSAKSMQCSYDDRGNSVPTILLMMQKRLYVEGGLKAEGIFRINAENSHEEYVRNELNKGVVPRGIDVHCLAGLIKAWFRELPSGVLDSLTPEQVMHCNTEDDCTQLVKLLPSTESALLDWAINLMADVVEHEQYNKMNARNIAMVFAPNMTQMADPLTALIHAVQVMNLLKTLILKTLRTREESAAKARLRSCADSPDNKSEHCDLGLNRIEFCEKSLDNCAAAVPTTGNFLYLNSCTPEVPNNSMKFTRSATMTRVQSNTQEKYRSFHKKSDGETEFESVSASSPQSSSETGTSENECKGGYENGDWLSLRKGVRRLCRHPVFQLSKPSKKTRGMGFVNSREGGETWA